MRSSIMPMSNPPVLIDTARVQARVQEIARSIEADLAGHELTVICILKGSFIFCADLIRAIHLPVKCEFMGLSSYHGGKTSSGEVKVTLDMKEPIEGCHVLVVEDIVDTGLTLQYILNALKLRQPASLRCASFLLKREALQSDLKVDYVGFEIPNRFVVGYGLDYQELYRNLPYIGVLD